MLTDHLNPDRVWINEEIILKKLSVGVNPWDAGRGAIPDNKATSAITLIGIVNSGNPTQAYQDGLNIASMLQEGPGRYRDSWKETCEEQNRDFFEELEGDPSAGFRSMADRLVDVLEAERDAATDRSHSPECLTASKRPENKTIAASKPNPFRTY